MNDYILGAWEALNYSIRCLKTKDKHVAIEELETIQEKLEANMASRFEKKF